MLSFIIGLILGAVGAFFSCALLSANGEDGRHD